MGEVSGKRVPVRTVTLNGQPVRLVKLGDIAEVKVGLQTGDNEAYLFQNPNARGSYRSIEDCRECLLTEADLERIRSDENLRHEVIQRGISKDNRRSSRFFGGRYIVPYDKGGESDSDEGWMPNYWVPTDYFIDWSESAVHCLLNDGRIRASSSKPYPRNIDSYFVEGITFSSRGIYAPTFRRNCGAVYDKESSGVFVVGSVDEFLAVLASRCAKQILKGFLQQTVSMDVDALKELPVPARLSGFADFSAEIIEKQQNNLRYDYASNEQLEIDRLVYAAYGLNEADIREVEDWYARRYPKLAQAQRRALAAKQGRTEEQLLARPVLHLYCDESRHLPHDREPCMLLGLVACPAERVAVYHEELKALRRDHGVSPHLEVKWTKVSPGQQDFYLALVDWFLGKDDLQFRGLVLPDKQNTLGRLPEMSREFCYYRLYYQLLRGQIEPENRYRAFLDIKDTRGQEKLTELKKLLQTNAADAEAVADMQHVRSHEVGLLQLTDLLLGAAGFARHMSTAQSSPAKRALISRLEERLGYPLRGDSPQGSSKVIIATWHDADALLL